MTQLPMSGLRNGYKWVASVAGDYKETVHYSMAIEWLLDQAPILLLEEGLSRSHLDKIRIGFMATQDIPHKIILNDRLTFEIKPIEIKIPQ